MESLNLADNTTTLTSVSVQDAPLEGDSVSQSHVHEIPKNEISSSERSFHDNNERENKRTRPWRETWSNYDTHHFPRTYQRDNNMVGYNGQTYQGYNGRGITSRNYPNDNIYPQSRTYHRDNANNSGQSYGYHVHRYHDRNANSKEQHHARNYVEHPRTYHRDNIKNATNSSYDRPRQPWCNDRPRQPWNHDRQQVPCTNDRSQPWSNEQRQTWTDDRRQLPWTNDRSQSWSSEQRQTWTDDRRQQPWTNDRQRQPGTNDRQREPWTNDRQQQPWTNSGENMAHQGSPHVYNRPRSYRLQNVARPYRFHERETSHGLQNVNRQYRFPAKEESRIYGGRDRVASNLNVADNVETGSVPFDIHLGKNDQDQKPWVMWPVPCEGNVSLKQTEMRSEKSENEPKQELERSSVHEQKPMFRGLGDCLRKKLLILDVNGLLADVIFPPPKEDKADINIYRRAIFKRPFVDDFLKFCFERFDVAIWSSRTKKILDGVVDYLLGDMRCKLLFCWDQSHCTKTGVKTLENHHKELLLKEIKKVWEKHEADLPYEKGYYNESNTLLLDDSPYKALLNPKHSAIFPHTYSYKDTSDNSLGVEGDLRVYLTGLVTAESVKRYVEEHPFGQQPIDETSSSWDFYLSVITGQDSSTTSELNV